MGKPQYTLEHRRSVGSHAHIWVYNAQQIVYTSRITNHESQMPTLARIKETPAGAQPPSRRRASRSSFTACSLSS